MWLSDRRAFLTGLAALAGLTGCGFAPVHAPGGAGRALMGAVRADDPVTRRDYQFVAALEELVGRPQAPRYALGYTIRQSALDRDAARVQLHGRLDYVLTDIATGTEITSGRVENFTGYSTSSTQLAQLAAAEDAELRLMRILADSVVTRLMLLPNLAPA